MSDIADFLRARYAEQRAIAEAAAEQAGTGDWRYQPGSDHVAAVQTFPNDVPARRESWTPLVTEAGSYIGDTIDDEIGNHIATHNPDAVIADLDAKLAIVDEHPAATGWNGRKIDGKVCRTCSETSQDGELTGDPYPCRTLRLLARPFAGHPDHKGEEWAP